MAFWNAPLPVRDHPMAACTAALKIRQRLVDIRKGTSQEAWIEICVTLSSP